MSREVQINLRGISVWGWKFALSHQDRVVGQSYLRAYPSRVQLERTKLLDHHKSSSEFLDLSTS